MITNHSATMFSGFFPFFVVCSPVQVEASQLAERLVQGIVASVEKQGSQTARAIDPQQRGTKNYHGSSLGDAIKPRQNLSAYIL
jgi:hypothetical protein